MPSKMTGQYRLCFGLQNCQGHIHPRKLPDGGHVTTVLACTRQGVTNYVSNTGTITRYVLQLLAEAVRSKAMKRRENGQGCNDPPITLQFRNNRFKLRVKSNDWCVYRITLQAPKERAV